MVVYCDGGYENCERIGIKTSSVEDQVFDDDEGKNQVFGRSVSSFQNKDFCNHDKYGF